MNEIDKPLDEQPAELTVTDERTVTGGARLFDMKRK